MPKTITLTILFAAMFSLSTCAQSKIKMSAARFEGLKGKVKTVSFDDTIFDEFGKVLRKKGEVYIETTYDELGNETGYVSHVKGVPTIKNIKWESGGEFFSKNEKLSTPDLSNEPPPPPRKIEDQRPKKPIDNSFDFKYKPDFDEKGFLVSESIYGNDGTMRSRRVYSYDTFGKKVKETVFTEKGTSYNDSTLYTYDTNGILTDETNLLGDGSGDESRARPNHKLKYEYISFDKQGNWLERKVFDSINNKPAESEPKLVRIEYQTVTYY